MSITGIVFACAAVGGIGIVIGVLLGIAGRKFAVETDEKEVGEAPANGCPVGGAAVAEKVAQILGVEVETVKKIAFVKCAGDCEKAGNKYEYTGNMSCTEASFVSGGPKECKYGCMGYGSCVNVCEYDAIHIVNGIAVVDKDKCVACGKCVKACPKGLIELIPYDNKYHVQCNSREDGNGIITC